MPELTHLNLTSDVIKNLTLPIDGGESYSQCYMYDRNYTGWTEDDVYWCIANPAACNASLTACTDWTYDTSVYTATVTTDVRHIIFTCVLMYFKLLINKILLSVFCRYYCVDSHSHTVFESQNAALKLSRLMIVSSGV